MRAKAVPGLGCPELLLAPFDTLAAMPDQHFEELGRKLSEAAESGDENARAVLARLGQFKDDPDDNSLDWLNEAAVRWESEHPELAQIAVRLINALTAGGL